MKKVESLMEKKGIKNLSALERKADISNGTARLWSKRTTNPKIDTVLRLTSALGCTVEDLLK